VTPLLVVAVTETWYLVTSGYLLNRASCMATLIELIPEKQVNQFCCNKQTGQFSIVFFNIHTFITSSLAKIASATITILNFKLVV
jgi:hypothetical protein